MSSLEHVSRGLRPNNLSSMLPHFTKIIYGSVLALEKQDIYRVRISLTKVRLREQFCFCKGLPTVHTVKMIVVAVIGSSGPLPRIPQRMRGT